MRVVGRRRERETGGVGLFNWHLPWTEKQLRLGLGEGLSYVTRIPISEKRDFAKKGVDSNKLMNYLEWTIDVPLKQFSAFEPMFRSSSIQDGGITDEQALTNPQAAWGHIIALGAISSRPIARVN